MTTYTLTEYLPGNIQSLPGERRQIVQFVIAREGNGGPLRLYATCDDGRIVVWDGESWADVD